MPEIAIKSWNFEEIVPFCKCSGISIAVAPGRCYTISVIIIVRIDTFAQGFLEKIYMKLGILKGSI